MKIIYNKIIPFPGYKAINLFGILFVREGARMSEVDLNHESIHTEQMKEMLWIFFYIWYIIEWVVKIFKYGPKDAYRNLSFEREAYENQGNLEYLKERKHFSWFKRL